MADLLVALPPEKAELLNRFFTFVGKQMLEDAVHASSWDDLIKLRELGYYMQGPLADFRAALEDTRARLEELQADINTDV